MEFKLSSVKHSQFVNKIRNKIPISNKADTSWLQTNIYNLLVDCLNYDPKDRLMADSLQCLVSMIGHHSSQYFLTEISKQKKIKQLDKEEQLELKIKELTSTLDVAWENLKKHSNRKLIFTRTDIDKGFYNKRVRGREGKDGSKHSISIQVTQ